MKYRYPTWYWGKYITKKGNHWVDQHGDLFPALQVNLSQMEIYNETEHGFHNSEEAQCKK